MAIFSNNDDNGLLLENYVDLIQEDTLSFSEYKDFIKVLTESIDPDEGYGNALRPIFIVLTKGTGVFSKVGDKLMQKMRGHTGDYWHSAIGFGPNLKHLYSFNSGKEGQGPLGGLSFESHDLYMKQYPDGGFEVSAFFVGTEKYNAFRESLAYFFKNKQKTKYDFLGLLKAVFDKNNSKSAFSTTMFCSTFVDNILKANGIDLVHDHNAANTSPDDLKFKEDQEKRFLIYKGTVKGYDEQDAIEKVDKLSQNVNNDYFKAKEKAEKAKEDKKNKEK